MDTPNYPYLMEENDIDVDETRRPGNFNNNLKSIENTSNFRRTSPQRNSVRRNAWMRTSLRKGASG